jgi:5-methylcytosine-specific restriction protein A
MYNDYDEKGYDFQEEGYDSSSVSVDNDDSIASVMELNKGNFKINMGAISISDIVIPTPIKDSRKETYLGLMRSVEELGVLVPIQVMVSEGFAEYVEEEGTEEGYEGPKYVLLDGLRRIFALKKNGLDRVNAVIYDFDDKDKGSDMINIISSILNKTQRKSWSEIWYMYQVLEGQSALTPGNIEYLLQLEPGDAMKLKEVMTRKDEFPEPAEDLLSKKKTLQQAYNMLNKLMKEQDQLAKEDISGVSDIDETEGVVNEEGNDNKLSDDEVKEILDMEDSFDGDLSEEDFDELMGNNLPDDRQTVGDRHPLDPALKAETLLRDGYCCQACGAGKGFPLKYALSFLQSHHKISVANSGVDTPENIITLCQNCHTSIHCLLKSGMRFGISKEEFDKLPDETKNNMKNIMKIARIDWEAGKRLGKNKDDFRRDNLNSSKFKMPGTDLSENMRAIQQGKEV